MSAGCRGSACNPKGRPMALSDYHLHVSIAVSDIQQAVAFYEGKLGLPVLGSGPSAQIAEGSRVYGSGGGPALNVYQSDTAGKSPATLATWYVDDIDQIVDELTASASSSPATTPSRRMPKASLASRWWADRLVPGPRRQHLCHRGRHLTRRGRRSQVASDEGRFERNLLTAASPRQVGAVEPRITSSVGSRGARAGRRPAWRASSRCAASSPLRRSG